MKKVLLSLLFLPSFSFCGDADVEFMATLFVHLANGDPEYIDPSVEDILHDFVYIKVERTRTGGSLNSDMIQRLAASEHREQHSHGKDYFWRTVLAEREQEEEAAALLQRLES